MQGKKMYKIVFCGATSTGKTQLIKKHTNNLAFNPESRATTGVDFAIKDTDTTQLQFWEVSGNETNARSLKACFIDAGIIVVCVDLSDKESFTQLLKRQVGIVKNTIKRGGAKPSKFILVGTKADLRNTEEYPNPITDADLKAAADELLSEDCLGCYVTSAKLDQYYEVNEADAGKDISKEEATNGLQVINYLFTEIAEKVYHLNNPELKVKEETIDNEDLPEEAGSSSSQDEPTTIKSGTGWKILKVIAYPFVKVSQFFKWAGSGIAAGFSYLLLSKNDDDGEDELQRRGRKKGNSSLSQLGGTTTNSNEQNKEEDNDKIQKNSDENKEKNKDESYVKTRKDLSSSDNNKTNDSTTFGNNG